MKMSTVTVNGCYDLVDDDNDLINNQTIENNINLSGNQNCQLLSMQFF